MYKPFKMKAAGYGNSPMMKNFPDLSGDGKVTQKDVLMGKDVIPTPNKKYKTAMKKYGCKKCKSAMCMCGAKHKK